MESEDIGWMEVSGCGCGEVGGAMRGMESIGYGGHDFVCDEWFLRDGMIF